MNEPLNGLEDVVIATSSITYIDGEKGILRYRGYDASELAEKSTYEETAYLIIHGHLPSSTELNAFQAELRANRSLAAGMFPILEGIPAKTDAMAWLRTGVSALSAFDSDSEENNEAANLSKTMRLTAQLATMAAAIFRLKQKKTAILPDDTLDHAGNFLYMLTGKKPDELSRRAMDMAFILQADHELNASTFAARVTTSTLSDMHSGVTSAIGTLKGPLHGGANQRVMEMLEKIGFPDKAESFLREQLAAKKKVMGFGHRVYTTIDPRAAVLKQKSKELSQKVGPAKWFEMSEILERIMVNEKRINPNLDFYSATVFRYLGIETNLYPVIFAISRIVGWCTHIMEQYKNNRLIRPLSQYTGPQGLIYEPISKRQAATVNR